MWKHVKRVGIIMGLIGTPMAWLSTHSISATIKDADGFIVKNLKWFGVEHPPKALATAAADHIGAVIGYVFMLMATLAVLLWAVERVFGKERVEQAPAAIREFIERHIHHREIGVEAGANVNLDIVVHRAEIDRELPHEE